MKKRLACAKKIGCIRPGAGSKIQGKKMNTVVLWCCLGRDSAFVPALSALCIKTRPSMCIRCMVYEFHLRASNAVIHTSTPPPNVYTHVNEYIECDPRIYVNNREPLVYVDTLKRAQLVSLRNNKGETPLHMLARASLVNFGGTEKRPAGVAGLGSLSGRTSLVSTQVPGGVQRRSLKHSE